jgi:hypothetical protein
MSAPSSKNTPGPSSPETTQPSWLDVLREKVEGLRYGVVEITVSDWEVTQIVQTEKIRLPASNSRPDTAPGIPDAPVPAANPPKTNFPSKTDQSAGGQIQPNNLKKKTT